MSRVLARHRLEFGSCVPLRPKTRVRSPRRPFFPEFLLSACASLPIAQPAPSPDSASLHPEQRRHGRRRRSPPCHPPFRWPSLPVTSPLSTAYQRRPDPAAGIGSSDLLLTSLSGTGTSKQSMEPTWLMCVCHIALPYRQMKRSACPCLGRKVHKKAMHFEA
ncbi:hypothetical protein BRADI_3g50163v3 [Brachypodium distachyon]|uniref:Uncharacterized protein n=1 Tax=Brachypodium distachyon TaxID=15368 RepID=A0A2K2D4D7_BRADI|nr:hypothetical protein BRADI_3g50163v3 [Brachypodium distachyon]